MIDSISQLQLLQDCRPGEPILEAYEEKYSFERWKALLLLAGPETFACVGWPGDRRALLEHLLSAATLQELFDLKRIERQPRSAK